MTDRRGSNVWGTPSVAEPTQSWPGRPGVGQVPPPLADTAAPRRPPGSLEPTLRRTRDDLVVWGWLALSALLLLVFAFALWDRPVDSSPTPTTVSSTTETSDAP